METTTNKTTRKISDSEIRSFANERKRILSEKEARTNGNPNRVETASNSGIYPVYDKLTGTGVLTRYILSIALKTFKKDINGKVSSESVYSIIDDIISDFKYIILKGKGKTGGDKPNVVRLKENPSPLSKAIYSDLLRTGANEEYGNLKNVLSGIKREISKANILGISFKEPKATENISVFKKVLALK